jgi:hypothetical protein
MSLSPLVLLGEDNPQDVYLIRMAMAEYGVAIATFRYAGTAPSCSNSLQSQTKKLPPPTSSFSI